MYREQKPNMFVENLAMALSVLNVFILLLKWLFKTYYFIFKFIFRKVSERKRTKTLRKSQSFVKNKI